MGASYLLASLCVSVQISMDEWLSWGRDVARDAPEYVLLSVVWLARHAFVPDPLMAYLESKLDPAAKQKHLAGSSSFTEPEVAQLQVLWVAAPYSCAPVSACAVRAPTQLAYNKLRSESGSGVVDLAALSTALGRLLPPVFLTRLFAHLDTGRVGVVNVEAFVVTLATCCNGSMEDKARLAFDLFDPERSGVLTPAAVRVCSCVPLAPLHVNYVCSTCVCCFISAAARPRLLCAVDGTVCVSGGLRLQRDHHGGSGVCEPWCCLHVPLPQSQSPLVLTCVCRRPRAVQMLPVEWRWTLESCTTRCACVSPCPPCPAPLFRFWTLHSPCCFLPPSLPPPAPDSPIDFPTYSAWLLKHPEVVNFLDNFAAVARLELGVKPPSLKEEAALIQSVFKVRVFDAVCMAGGSFVCLCRSSIQGLPAPLGMSGTS